MAKRRSGWLRRFPSHVHRGAWGNGFAPWICHDFLREHFGVPDTATRIMLHNLPQQTDRSITIEVERAPDYSLVYRINGGEWKGVKVFTGLYEAAGRFQRDQTFHLACEWQ